MVLQRRLILIDASGDGLHRIYDGLNLLNDEFHVNLVEYRSDSLRNSVWKEPSSADLGWRRQV